MNRWDALLALAILLLAGGVWLAPSPSTSGVVLRGPNGVTRVDMSVDADYRVAGTIGAVDFRVRGGELSCVHSSCADGLCQRMGALRSGRPIVCAPNGVIARCVPMSGDLDATSR